MQVSNGDIYPLNQVAKEMIDEKKSEKKNVEKVELPEISDVAYHGRFRGRIDLANGTTLVFEWSPASMAGNALNALETYQDYCKKLIDKHFASLQAEPPKPTGPDYSKLESGKHYWVLRNRIIYEKSDPIWVVAKYTFTDLYPWTCVGFVNPVSRVEILKIGDRVPHPEDK